METIEKLYNALELHRKDLEWHEDSWDTRLTHCHLLKFYSGKAHIFQVRGWDYYDEFNKYPTLRINVVNWTITAGTATIYLQDDEDAKDWYILEDNPTLRVLYGNE